IPYPDDEMKAGLTVLDTKTGAIRAIGGGRSVTDGEPNHYNYAIQGRSQLGSTAKPIISYGPAIEYNKWSTYQQLHDDKPYDIGDISFNNYDGRFHGWMSMRKALLESYNIPALKTLEETGLSNAKEFAEGLGINFANDKISIGD